MADYAAGFVAGEFLGEELGPAGVVVEVAGDERDVDVARFADGLAVVESFEDGKAAGVFLDLAGDGVEISRAGVGSERLPSWESVAGGFYGGVDVVGGALGDVG